MPAAVLRPSKVVAVLARLCVSVACLSAGRLWAAVDKPTLEWIQSSLKAWQGTCLNDLHIVQAPLPWIIAYDEVHAWHINPERGMLPKHTRTLQTVAFSGRKYEIFEVVNHGSVWVPGRDPLPAVPRIAAMLYADETKPFFVMGTPAFQQRALRVADRDGGDFTNLLTGAMLHELTHTRQLPYVMPQIKREQSLGKYPERLDDNVIQTAFAANDEFRLMYEQECSHLSAGVLALDPEEARAKVQEALQIMQRRRRRFFSGDHEGWSSMEDIFLAIEGSAMWVQFQSALRLAPQGQPWLETLTLLGRRSDAWSQAEGLVLFLSLDRFSPGWQAQFFGRTLPSPVQILDDAVNLTSGKSWR